MGLIGIPSLGTPYSWGGEQCAGASFSLVYLSMKPLFSICLQLLVQLP